MKSVCLDNYVRRRILNEPKVLSQCRLHCCSSHQVQHAAQHGQQQEGSLCAHIVDGADYRRTGGRHAEDERPDGVQVKLRRQTHILG